MTSSTNLRAVAALAAAVTLLTGCTSGSAGPDPAPTDPTPVGTTTPSAMPTDPTDPTDPATATPAPVGSEPLETDPGETALVLVDGWSLRAAGSASFDVQVDGTERPLDFTAVTGAQLAALLDSHPEVVETLIGRMVDGASTVDCGTDGCLIGGEPVDGAADDILCADGVCVADGHLLDRDQVAALADAHAIPGYGTVYASWDINALAYVARVGIADASSLSVRRDTEQLALPLSARQDDFTDEEPAEDSDPLATGYGQDVHLLAFGLGELFRPAPTWQDQHNAPYLLPASPPATAEPGDVADLGGLPLMGGVGTSRAAADGLTEGQLTYLSSPTTGCGVGLQCVPTGTVQGDVSVATADTVTVCGRDTETMAIVTDATVTFDMDGQVHQLGLWNGKQPDEFTGHTGGFFSGQPELVGDGTTMRLLAVHVLQGGGTVYDVAGQVYQLGVDDPAVAERDVTAAEVVATTGTWKVC